MSHAIVAELVGNVMSVVVAGGRAGRAGDTIVILESMKMEIPVLTEVRRRRARPVRRRRARVVREGDVLAVIDPVLA